MAYEVVITKRAMKDQLSVPKTVRRLVDGCITCLKDDPRPPGSKKLTDRGDLRSARTGVFRVLYRVDDKAGKVEILRVKHRGKAYRNL